MEVFYDRDISNRGTQAQAPQIHPCYVSRRCNRVLPLHKSGHFNSQFQQEYVLWNAISILLLLLHSVRYIYAHQALIIMSGSRPWPGGLRDVIGHV